MAQASNLPRSRHAHFAWRVLGAACGLLISALANRLGLGAVILFLPLQSFWVMGALGAWLGAGRARWMGIAGVVAMLALAAAVERTPWATRAVSGLVVRDGLRRSDAVVVLAADIAADGTPTPQSQRRLSHSYALLGQGWAPRLVLTRFAAPKPSYAPAVRKQLKAARISSEIVETGPIRITSDEAREVAALARRSAWKRAILVTDRSHTRRAAALFREAGLGVLCSPCPDPRYEIEPAYSSAQSAEQRRAAFRDWLYETVWFHAHFSLRLV